MDSITDELKEKITVNLPALYHECVHFFLRPAKINGQRVRAQSPVARNCCRDLSANAWLAPNNSACALSLSAKVAFSGLLDLYQS